MEKTTYWRTPMERYDAFGHRFLDKVEMLDDKGKPSHVFHPGLDIGEPGEADFNKAVFACAHGRIEYAKKDGGWGNHIFIRHLLPDGSTLFSHYAHLNKMSVKVGQDVTPDTQIGTCGKTGNAKGSHVHWEIRKPIGRGYLFYPVGETAEWVKAHYVNPLDWVLQHGGKPAVAPVVTTTPTTAPVQVTTTQFDTTAIKLLHELLPQTPHGNVEGLVRELVDLYRQTHKPSIIQQLATQVNTAIGLK